MRTYIEETRLLPHVNAGTMSEKEILALRPVAASMGMMLETVSKRLTKTGEAHSLALTKFHCSD